MRDVMEGVLHLAPEEKQSYLPGLDKIVDFFVGLQCTFEHVATLSPHEYSFDILYSEEHRNVTLYAPDQSSFTTLDVDAQQKLLLFQATIPKEPEPFTAIVCLGAR